MDYDLLDLFSSEELINELKERGLRRKRPLNIDKNIVREEYELLKNIENLGRKTIYNDPDISPEERFIEKTWWWITDTDHAGNMGWHNDWIESHSSGNVGLNNVKNREAWLKKTLKDIPKNMSILDAGAGELQYKKFCNHLKYTSQDFAQYTGEGDGGSLQTGEWDNSKLDIVSDIADIPVKDSSFDAIMCIEVFEHIPKPIEAIAEFHRILKKEGTLIITAPFAALTHFSPYFFYNGFSAYFYEEILAEYGFEVQEMYFNGNYFEYIAQELYRLNDIALKYSGKKAQLTELEKMALKIILNKLAYASKKDTGSHELLCHGINIKAKKK